MANNAEGQLGTGSEDVDEEMICNEQLQKYGLRLYCLERQDEDITKDFQCEGIDWNLDLFTCLDRIGKLPTNEQLSTNLMIDCRHVEPLSQECEPLDDEVEDLAESKEPWGDDTEWKTFLKWFYSTGSSDDE